MEASEVRAPGGGERGSDPDSDRQPTIIYQASRYTEYYILILNPVIVISVGVCFVR